MPISAAKESTVLCLRVGVFFDGTGNNLHNSELVAACMGPDSNLASAPFALREHCAKYGYDGRGSVPTDSYGTAKTNIAKLYELYRDQAAEQVKDGQTTASLKVYVEGIGTQAGEKDSSLSMMTGRYGSGVIARAQQAPAAVIEQVRRWSASNPGTSAQRIEFDIFGFSRGAAAARHFANDLGKGAGSALAQLWPRSEALLRENFDWQSTQFLAINFIGLYDSVAAIISVLEGNLSPANAQYSGVEMKLRPTAARKIVQLVARDEQRKNFPLTQTDNDIVVPGAHSDVGGGYLPEALETVVLTRPISSTEPASLENGKSQACKKAQLCLERDQHTWQSLNLQLEVCTQVDALQPGKRDTPAEKRVIAFVQGKRRVAGDLALIYLRIMHRLSVDQNVPFEALDEQRMALPPALQVIADKLMQHAQGQQATSPLNECEEALLRKRYIHLSSHWGTQGAAREAIDAIYLNRPHENGQRSIYPNE